MHNASLFHLFNYLLHTVEQRHLDVPYSRSGRLGGEQPPGQRTDPHHGSATQSARDVTLRIITVPSVTRGLLHQAEIQRS